MQRVLESRIDSMRTHLTRAPMGAFAYLLTMRTPITLVTGTRTLACNFVSRVYTPTSD
jgi:hypothetical protein